MFDLRTQRICLSGSLGVVRFAPDHELAPYWSAEMPPDQTSDESLMLRYRAGDSAAFETLYSRHKGGLFRYVLRQCDSRAVAEELFQEIWMNLIRARADYKVEAKFTTYLYRIAHNRLIDYHRGHAGAREVSLENESEEWVESIPAPRPADPLIAAMGREQAQRLLKLIAGLPEAQREAFLLQQEADMTVEEIAQATSVNRETAKSRLRYAIAKLREGMGYERAEA